MSAQAKARTVGQSSAWPVAMKDGRLPKDPVARRAEENSRTLQRLEKLVAGTQNHIFRGKMGVRDSWAPDTRSKSGGGAPGARPGAGGGGWKGRGAKPRPRGPGPRLPTPTDAIFGGWQAHGACMVLAEPTLFERSDKRRDCLKRLASAADDFAREAEAWQERPPHRGPGYNRGIQDPV